MIQICGTSCSANRPPRARFIEQLAREAGGRVLDVGCATGSFCRLLRRRGVEAEGVDINPRFVEAARAKNPDGRFHVGDMRTLTLGQTFDVVACLGTTFCYNLTNREIAATLARLREHVRPGRAGAPRRPQRDRVPGPATVPGCHAPRVRKRGRRGPPRRFATASIWPRRQ